MSDRLYCTKCYLSEGWSFKDGRKGQESLQQKWKKRWRSHRWEGKGHLRRSDMVAGGETTSTFTLHVGRSVHTASILLPWQILGTGSTFLGSGNYYQCQTASQEESLQRQMCWSHVWNLPGGDLLKEDNSVCERESGVQSCDDVTETA